MNKLKLVEIGKDFNTTFNKSQTIFIFGRLDYERDGITLGRKFDAVDELILNAIYSLGRALAVEDDGNGKFTGEWQPIFTARKILQHIFGNVADHFQKEIVEVIEHHIENMSCMKLTLDLRDNLDNDAFVTVNGEQYHLATIKENLLDVTAEKEINCRIEKIRHQILLSFFESRGVQKPK